MAIPNWLYLSQTAGTSGITIITVSASTDSSTLESANLFISQINKSSLFKNVTLTEERRDYNTEYLTFEILEDGVINWRASSNDYVTTISYSRNNGSTWTNLTSTTSSSSTTGGRNINVSRGERILFKGENNDYFGNAFSLSTAKFKLYGNITSLLYGDEFSGVTGTTTYSGRFYMMFYNLSNLMDVSNLILPAQKLSYGCYESMFQNCTNITKAPELPATKLVDDCYERMFQGCSSLNYIKCLAENGASNCTYNWVNGVSESGTFVKKSGVSWSTGVSGIPSGWTVISE